MRISGRVPGEGTDGWFDDPLPDDRRSWAVPPGHGTYQGLDLERPDPDDEDERTFLLQAQHLEMEEALEHHEEMTGPDGEPVNIRPSWNKGYATEAARNQDRGQFGCADPRAPVISQRLTGRYARPRKRPVPRCPS
jgi:hypothetical protein